MVGYLIPNPDVDKEINVLFKKLEASHYTDYDYYILRDNMTNIFFKLFNRSSPFIEFFDIADRTLSLSASSLFHEKFGSRPIQNSKTLILTIMACLNLAKMGSDEYLNKAKRILDVLLDKHIKSYSSNSIFIGAPFKHWYSFGTCNPKFFEEGSPNLYLTSLLGKALFQLTLMDKSFYDLSLKVASFFSLGNCFVQIQGKPFFKYHLSSDDALLVHNANTSVASFLIGFSNICSDKSLKDHFRDLGVSSLQTSIEEIDQDGCLPYFSKYDLKRYQPNIIDNFHTGFVICDLIDSYMFTRDIMYKEMATRVLGSYVKMFDKDGLPSYSPYKRYPIDIHNSAVGIITFSKASEINKGFMLLAEKVYESAKNTFLDSDGLFFFQKYPFKMHKAKFLRWNQAWMLLALSQLEVTEIKEKRFDLM